MKLLRYPVFSDAMNPNIGASFPLFPLSRFESGQTSIKRPREFTYFSYDDKKQLHPRSLASLKYYYPPFIATPGTSTPGLSLSNGFEDWIQADSSVDGHLDALLDTIEAHEDKLMGDGETPILDVRKQADFVTWRGMMTKVSTSQDVVWKCNADCFWQDHDSRV